MNLHFICPHCGQHLSGDVPPVGTEANCPSCGNGFRVAGAVPVRHHHHPPSREQMRREEARGRTMFFLIIGGAALLLGLLGWGASVAMSWRREAQELSQQKPGAIEAFREALDRQNQWRKEDAKKRDAAEAVVRENSLKRIRTRKDEFMKSLPLAKLVLTANVFEGDSGLADEMLREMEALYDEAIASHTDKVEGNEIYDAPVHMEQHLMARLLANAKVRVWMAKRSTEDFWGRLRRRPSAPGADDRNPLPDFLASGKYRSTGTGFWISGDGWLLTNHHVTGSASKVDIRTADGKILSAKVVATDEKQDIALLQAGHKPLIWLPLSSGEPGIGEYVFTVGFPNTLVQGVTAKFTDGRLSSLSGIRDDKSFYQTSVPVQPGNSGGALVHSKSGWVVGMITLKLNTVPGGGSADNVSYALKSRLLHEFIKKQNAALGAAVLKTSLPANPAEREIITCAEQATALVLVE